MQPQREGFVAICTTDRTLHGTAPFPIFLKLPENLSLKSFPLPGVSPRPASLKGARAGYQSRKKKENLIFVRPLDQL